MCEGRVGEGCVSYVLARRAAYPTTSHNSSSLTAFKLLLVNSKLHIDCDSPSEPSADDGLGAGGPAFKTGRGAKPPGAAVSGGRGNEGGRGKEGGREYVGAGR